MQTAAFFLLEPNRNKKTVAHFCVMASYKQFFRLFLAHFFICSYTYTTDYMRFGFRVCDLFYYSKSDNEQLVREWPKLEEFAHNVRRRVHVMEL